MFVCKDKQCGTLHFLEAAFHSLNHLVIQKKGHFKCVYNYYRMKKKKEFSKNKYCFGTACAYFSTSVCNDQQFVGQNVTRSMNNRSFSMVFLDSVSVFFYINLNIKYYEQSTYATTKKKKQNKNK